MGSLAQQAERPERAELGPLVGELRQIALVAGLDALGVAPADPFTNTRAHLEERKAAGLHGGMHFTYGDPARSTDPRRALPGAAALVVAARSYLRDSPPDPDPPSSSSAGGSVVVPRGRVARYSWQDHYAVLREGLGAVARRLRSEGWGARVLADDNALVDREAAYRAGLGWYGKNANLLAPGRGSWFVLGSVVTDAPLPPATEVATGSCGSCTRCLVACPTGAIVAPGVVDARRCLAWLLQAPGSFPVEHRVALGERIYGCDDCQEVCPPNRLEVRARPPRPAGPDDQPWAPLLELLEAGDDELLSRYGRWYVPRRQPRFLRRNALVVLGNVGHGSDPDVARVLAAALAGPDPLLREHAAWAATRLGRADLVEGAAPVGPQE